MVRLRVPRVGDFIGLPPDPRHRQPNRIRLGQTCQGCRWPDRCQRDALCWTAEKRDIAAERAAR